jgi:hypothetical protein
LGNNVILRRGKRKIHTLEMVGHVQMAKSDPEAQRKSSLSDSKSSFSPTDLEYGSPRVRVYDEGTNQRAREDSLDQLDEARTVALMHSARYQQALRRYQARRIRRRYFNEGNLVLRLRQDNRGRHKLSPRWEGPYVVVKVLKPGTYKLANEDSEELINAWTIQQLRCFYA